MKIHPIDDRLVFRKLSKKAVVSPSGIEVISQKQDNRLEQVIGEVVAVGKECIREYVYIPNEGEDKQLFEVGDIIIVQPPTVENMTMYEAYEEGDDEFFITFDHYVLGLVEGFDAE